MGKIEQGYSAPEYLYKVGEEGIGLVRQIIRYHHLVVGFTSGLFNDEQKWEAKALAKRTEQFWGSHFPNFVGANGEWPVQPVINFLSQEAERQTERKEEDYIWAGEGAASWLQFWQENLPSLCRRQTVELLEVLDLPQAVLSLGPSVGDPEIIQAIGASERAPGLRFLPGYRLFEWDNSGTSEGLKLILGGKWTEGKIWLENQEGRRFFIASTGGALGVEELLRRRQTRIAVSDVVVNNLLPETEFTLFDIDRTLQIYRSGGWMGSYEDVTTPKMIKDRIKCLRNLAERGIKIGLWSRNSQETVESFARRLQKETGVDINFCLSLDSWPFLNTKDIPGDKYVFEVPKEATIEKHVSQSARKMGLTIDSRVWAGRIYDLLSQINLPAKRPVILEAKAPILAALWLGRDDPKIAKAMWEGGVIVNDAAETLQSALGFGFSFIHVDSINNLNEVAGLV